MAAENLVGNLPNKVGSDYQRPLPRDFEEAGAGSMNWKDETATLKWDIAPVLPAGKYRSFDTSVTSPSDGDIYFGVGDSTTLNSDWNASTVYDWARYTADTSSWSTITPEEGQRVYDTSGDTWYTFDSTTTGWNADTGGSTGIKRYVALITQSGTSAPTATVLENTLGTTLTWSYQAVGNYRGTLGSGTFDFTKTAFTITNGSGGSYGFFTAGEGSGAYMDVWSANTSAIDTNGLLVKATLIITIYP